MVLVDAEDVFPTRVGVNRGSSRRQSQATRIPHTRGGEPQLREAEAQMAFVFPTRVGVNRSRS